MIRRAVRLVPPPWALCTIVLRFHVKRLHQTNLSHDGLDRHDEADSFFGILSHTKLITDPLSHRYEQRLPLTESWTPQCDCHTPTQPVACDGQGSEQSNKNTNKPFLIHAQYRSWHKTEHLLTLIQILQSTSRDTHTIRHMTLKKVGMHFLDVAAIASCGTLCR